MLGAGLQLDDLLRLLREVVLSTAFLFIPHNSINGVGCVFEGVLEEGVGVGAVVAAADHHFQVLLLIGLFLPQDPTELFLQLLQLPLRAILLPREVIRGNALLLDRHLIKLFIVLIVVEGVVVHDHLLRVRRPHVLRGLRQQMRHLLVYPALQTSLVTDYRRTTLDRRKQILLMVLAHKDTTLRALLLNRRDASIVLSIDEVGVVGGGEGGLGGQGRVHLGGVVEVGLLGPVVRPPHRLVGPPPVLLLQIAQLLLFGHELGLQFGDLLASGLPLQGVLVLEALLDQLVLSAPLHHELVTLSLDWQGFELLGELSVAEVALPFLSAEVLFILGEARQHLLERHRVALLLHPLLLQQALHVAHLNLHLLHTYPELLDLTVFLLEVSSSLFQLLFQELILLVFLADLLLHLLLQ
mmetsp:Transcript_22883/g.22156  ORF Transcript_22883/g.22156 Transcript_22883/m.22156 type:complete len:411 (-) Transcript_22883:376-1608(-)